MVRAKVYRTANDFYHLRLASSHINFGRVSRVSVLGIGRDNYPFNSEQATLDACELHSRLFISSLSERLTDRVV